MRSAIKAIAVRAPMEFGPADIPMPKCPRAKLVLKVYACRFGRTYLRTLWHGRFKVCSGSIIGHEIGEWHLCKWGKSLVTKTMTRHRLPCEHQMRVGLSNIGSVRIR